MKTYQYQVLRYLPDRVSGEFVNLGVVVFDPESRVLQYRFYAKTGRVHAFFPSVHARFLTRTLRDIEAALGRLTDTVNAPLPLDTLSLDDITRRVLSKDDSALFFTDVREALDADIAGVLTDLYNRMVCRHLPDTHTESRSDEQVWRELYKAHFEKYDLARQLQPRTVRTAWDEWDFDKTVQKGALHCFEPVSFHLAADEHVKNKVYTWAGRVAELQSAREALHVYLLSELPGKPELQALIREKLGRLELGNATVELLEPEQEQVDGVLSRVREELERHG